MKWSPGDRSNIEDRRGGGGMRGGMSLGIGGLLIVGVLSLVTGTDFFTLLNDSGALTTQTGSSEPGQVATSPQEERVVDFVAAVAGDTQDAWAELLGPRYERTVVSLFRNSVDSACGMAESATGPFYCPSDHKVYLDLSFFEELDEKFGAPGDFAQAYVIAHEFGHHVQNLLGTSDRVARDRRTGPQSASVALELQADCYAGVWGNTASKSGRFRAGKVELEPGDADEALRAASSIGDDRLQKMGTGRVQPERFTHGSSAQRMEWFQRGLQSGDPGRCDTFAALTQ
ncbi:MAG: neutral zinc metallopeptidase [Vicinamibacterales bacterium]